ncbi:MAG: NYN domain-containing protein, partial [Acidimicrobiales bacterium]
PAPDPAPGLDRDGLAAAVAAASAAAEHLSAALAGAARLLEQPVVQAPTPPEVAQASGSAGEVRVGRRVPVRLPPGVIDDEPAAADHLVRVTDAVLVVDGYNVSQEGWPGTTIAEQRSRLVDALVELHARTGIEVLVVFDGAEGYDTRHSPLRVGVRVRFSPPGVEADDVVLDFAASLPPSRPVVVVSSDRRVRDGAHQLGANLLHSRQLLTALHR